MQQFEKGLILRLNDRDAVVEYIRENASGPASFFESWGSNAPPESVHIRKYHVDDTDGNHYYLAYNKHANGEVTTHYWNENLLKELVDEGFMDDTGEYDVEFVKQFD
jgi:hypothetical protein